MQLDPDQRLESVFMKSFNSAKSLFAKMKLSKKPGAKRSSDHFDIKIELFSGDRAEVVSRGTGSYLEEVTFEDVVFWSFGNEPTEFKFLPQSELLPSDSSFRQDIHYIKRQNWIDAQDAKDEIEFQ